MTSRARSCGTHCIISVSSSSEVGSIQWTSSKTASTGSELGQALQDRASSVNSVVSLRFCGLTSGRRVALVGPERQKIRHSSDMRRGLGEQRFKLGAFGGGRVVALKTRRPFQVADEGEQRAVGVMRRTKITQPRVRLGLQTFLKRQSDVRLADAGFAGQENDAAVALRGLPPAARQQLDLFVPAEQWRQADPVLRLEPAFHRAQA